MDVSCKMAFSKLNLNNNNNNNNNKALRVEFIGPQQAARSFPPAHALN